MNALPDDPAPSVSDLFVQMRRARAQGEREMEAENNLMASLAALNMPEKRRWERAANRLREERLMGLHPARKTIISTEFQRRTGETFDDAINGAHVTVTRNGRPSFVVVSAAEYARLKVDARLLAFEGPHEVPPDDWGRE